MNKNNTEIVGKTIVSASKDDDSAVFRLDDGTVVILRAESNYDPMIGQCSL